MGVTAGVFVAVVATACGGPTRHRDGEGPLSSLRDPGGSTRMTVARQPDVESWSFGMPLCMEIPGASATLIAVEPTGAVGSGFDVVGTGVHEYTTASDEGGIISTNPFPPPGVTVRPVGGFVLDIECGDNPERLAELIVGLAVTGPEGGGLEGVDLSYSVEGREYVLHITNGMLICGLAVTETCEEPTPS